MSPRESVRSDTPGSLPTMFEEQVARTPGTLALEWSSGALDYAALNERANAVAHRLKALGVGNGSLVAICLPPSPEAICGILGVLKAGGAYVPLAPGTPPLRKRAILDAANVQWLLDFDGKAPQVSARDGGRVEGWPRLGPRENLPCLSHAADLAYVIFTSGSTGVPKGVMVEHDAARHLVEDLIERLRLGPGNRIFQFACLSFDASIFEVFCALLSGATLCLPNTREFLLGAELPNWWRRMRIDTAWAPPSLLATLPTDDLPLLKTLIAAAEPLPGPVAARWARGRRLLNGYGPTETCVFATMAEDLGQEEVPPIGRPLKHVELSVVDPETLREVPFGDAGELLVGGPALARGYLDNTEETALRFITNPFGDGSGRFYRTGDLVRQRPDGQFVFIGRRDRQVKLRGYRIELAEIERTMLLDPDVSHATVLLDEGAVSPRLVAFLVATESFDRAAATLRWERRLPPHMRPSVVLAVDAVPRLQSGKVDTRALLAMLDTQAKSCPAPQEDKFATLRAVFEKYVGTVRDDQSFFAAGGDSLSALRVLAELDNELGLRVSPSDFHESPTLATLTARLNASIDERGRQVATAAEGSLRADRRKPFPLLPVQQAYLAGSDPSLVLGNVVVQNSEEFECEELDTALLERALRRLSKTHAALRTVVVAPDKQRTCDMVTPPRVYVHDLGGLGEQEQRERLDSIRQEAVARPWDNANGARIDFTAIRLGGARWRLIARHDFSIVDHPSWQLLLRRLARLLRYPDEPLPEPPFEFQDYAQALLAEQNGSHFARSQEYWSRRVDSLPDAPKLPLARAPESVSHPTFRRRSGTLSEAQWCQLKDRARREGHTSASLVLACLADVLGTWSETTHFTINVPVIVPPNSFSLHQEVVGDFTSLILLEVMEPGRLTFRDRAARIAGQLWKDLDHRAYDGVRVIRDIVKVGRLGPGAFPVVFTSLIEAQNSPETHGELAGWHAPSLGRLVGGQSSTPQVWLDCHLREHRGTVTLDWDYVEELFPNGVVEDMHQALLTWLAELAESNDAWNLDFSATSSRLLPARQREDRLAYNRVPGVLPTERLHTSFARQVLRAPDADALLTSEVCLSYAELADIAATCGRRLLDEGVTDDELVAVVLPRGWSQIAAVIATHYAGAAYLPVDPTLPLARIRALLGEACVSKVITDDAELLESESLSALAPPDLTDVSRSPFSREAFEADARWGLSARRSPDAMAYAIFTSGSTGMPKGVMVSHRSAANTIQAINRRFQLAATDRGLSLSSLNFDLSVWDIYGFLAAGGGLYVLSASERREPTTWLRLLQEHGITVWNTVPQLLEMLLEACRMEETRIPATLRLALVSGDWVSTGLWERLRRSGSVARLVSLGGATEAAIWSIFFEVDGIVEGWETVPYGIPLENQACHVLNASLEPCPEWVPGELFIGGAGLATGYLADPALTRERFIFHPRTGERLYRTGDRARFREGKLEFLGRKDTQLKVRGYRVELGEIEAILCRHPDVASAVAVGLGSAHGSKRIAAAIVRRGHGGGNLSQAVLIHASEHLPEYMVPTTLVVLENLPLTREGKVDRKEVERALGRVQSARKDAPTTPVETILARLWTEVLELETVGRHDDFFALGGDSILAMQIVSRAHRLGIRLRVQSFFDSPRLVDLAQSAGRASQEVVERTAPLGETQLLPGQIWFLEQGLLLPHLWHEGHVVTPRGRLDAAPLADAFDSLLQQHDALRSTFHRRSDLPNDPWGWTQAVVARVSSTPLRTIPPNEYAQEEGRPVSRMRRCELVAEVLQSALSLEEGRVLLAALVEFGADEPQALVLVAHHLVVDGQSWRILFEDLQRCYLAFARGERPPEIASVTSYREWSLRLKEHAQSEAPRAELGYWIGEADCKMAALPQDYPGEPASNLQRSVYSTLTAEETALIVSGQRGIRFGVFELILAAVHHALADDTGQLLLDLMAHGREAFADDLRVERTVGRFSTVFPMRLTLNRKCPDTALMDEVRRQLGAVPHRGFNYGLLRYLAEPRHTNLDQARPQVCLNYAGRFDHVLDPVGPFKSIVEVPRSQRNTMPGTRRYLLELNSGLIHGVLGIEWRYSENTHRRATVESLARACNSELVRIARAIIPCPGDIARPLQNR